MPVSVVETGTVTALAHSTPEYIGVTTSPGLYLLVFHTDDGVLAEDEYYRIIVFSKILPAGTERQIQTLISDPYPYDGTKKTWFTKKAIPCGGYIRFQLSWWRNSMNPPSPKDFQWKLFKLGL